MSEDKVEGAARFDESPLVGGFSYDATHERWSWSPEVYRIHGFEPHDVVPTTSLIVFHAHPDDRDAVAEALTGAMSGPGTFTVHYRLVDAARLTRRVLLLGASAPLDESGQVHVRGQLVDLTILHDRMIQEDLGPVVDDFREHRAVIEQAKGIVIQLFAVGADEAFDRLRACSQAANVKVRDLAEYLVVAAAADRTPDKTANTLGLAEIFEVLSGGAHPEQG